MSARNKTMKKIASKGTHGTWDEQVGVKLDGIEQSWSAWGALTREGERSRAGEQLQT